MRRWKGQRGGSEGAACLPLCLSELRVFVRHEEALQVNAEVELAEELGQHNALGCEQEHSGRTEGRSIAAGAQRTDSLLSQLSRKTTCLSLTASMRTLMLGSSDGKLSHATPASRVK